MLRGKETRLDMRCALLFFLLFSGAVVKSAVRFEVEVSPGNGAARTSEFARSFAAFSNILRRRMSRSFVLVLSSIGHRRPVAAACVDPRRGMRLLDLIASRARRALAVEAYLVDLRLSA